MPNEDEVRRSSVDHLATEILRGLHEGRYVPGQKLIESELAQKFGIGRGSVREALRRLEAEGLITANLHRGARIRTFGRDDVRDLMEVTEHIVALVARLAAERAPNAKAVAGVRDIVEQAERIIADGDTFDLSALRYQFIRQTVLLTNNRELAQLMPRFDISIIKAQFRVAFDMNYARRDLVHMREFVDALAARDGEAAERIMRARTREAARVIQALPDHYFSN